MQISVLDKKAGELKADLFIVPVAEGEEKKGAVRELTAAVRADVEARVDKTKFKGRSGRTLTVQTAEADIVLAGIGKEKTAEALRAATGRGVAAAQAVRAKHIVVAAGAAAASDVAPLLEGVLLAGYAFERYKSRKKDDEPYKGPSRLTITGTEVSAGSAASKQVERVRAICEAVCYARDLINEMSTVKTPSYLAREARKITRGTGIRCDVWQGDKLVKEKMNGILAVSAGSVEPGAFIRMVYAI